MPKKLLKAQTPGEAITAKPDKDSLLPKIKPKMAQCGYMFFYKENFAKLKEQNPTLKVADLAKKMGENWKLQPEVAKKPYETLAQQDKVRHDRESKEFKEKGYFTTAKGVKSTDLKVTIKDFPEGTVLPKRVMSAFLIFQAENFKRLRAANPKQKITEIMKQSAAEWHKLSKSKLADYSRLHEADKKRYEKQVKQLEKVGYFTCEDGTKSIDMKFKPKKLSREALRAKHEKKKLEKLKTIAKRKAERAKAFAKKRAQIKREKDQNEKKRAQKAAQKAREQAKKAKDKESKALKLLREKSKKAKSLAAAKQAKLKGASKKSKGITKKGKTLSLKKKAPAQKKEKTAPKFKTSSADDQKNALRVFTKEKIAQVLQQCSGSTKSSRMKEATSMIKEMWENAAARTKNQYVRLARQV